jgi:hypothetical protein
MTSSIDFERLNVQLFSRLPSLIILEPFIRKNEHQAIDSSTVFLASVLFCIYTKETYDLLLRLPKKTWLKVLKARSVQLLVDNMASRVSP